MPTLQLSIEALASTFADGIIAAIRNASLEEILRVEGTSLPAKRRPGRPSKAAVTDGGGGRRPDSLPKLPKGKGGRLARRSESDLQHVIGLIVAKLGEHKAELRSEQLQKALKLDKRKITRPLELAMKTKKIVKTGKKRSTTYFAAK